MAPLDYKSSLSRYRRYLQAVQNQPLWRASLYLVLSLSLVIILVFAALRPTLITIASLIGQQKQQEEISTRLNQKITAVSAAQQQLSLASERLVYLEQALPTDSRIQDWSLSLQNVASQSAVNLDAVTISDISVKEASRTAEMKFSITASGQYAQLKQFLQLLQSLRRLITIQTVNLAKSTSPESTVTILKVDGILGRSK